MKHMVCFLVDVGSASARVISTINSREIMIRGMAIGENPGMGMMRVETTANIRKPFT
jgi:hypothetical protein